MIELLTSIWTGLYYLVIGLGIWAMTVGTPMLFVALMYRLKLSWLVTWPKVISIFAGWAIANSLGGLLDTFHHSGGGMITETEGADREGNGGSDYQVWLDEREYKRHEYKHSVGILAFGLLFWVLAQKVEHDRKVEEEYKVARSVKRSASGYASASEAKRLQEYLSAMEFSVLFRTWKEDRKWRENLTSERPAAGAD